MPGALLLLLISAAEKEKLVGLYEFRASLVYILSSSHSCTVGPVSRGKKAGAGDGGVCS